MHKNHINVIICTPGNTMESEYVKSLITTINYLNNNNISFTYSNQYSSQVDAAREATTMGSTFLNPFCNSPLNDEFTYDKIFWIDSDMSWSVDDFIKLYKSNYDFIGGLYLSKDGAPMFKCLDKDIYHINDLIIKNEIFEISNIGFGFVCIKNGVFEKIKRPWFKTKFIQLSDTNSDKTIMVPQGEDFSFCESAKEVGFKIFLDPSVKIDHYKKIKIGL